MPFDIHQNLYEDYDENALRHYQDQLIDLFEQSPEAQALLKESQEAGKEAHLWWAGAFMDYALNYLELPPPQMTPAGMRELLFDIFPQKISSPDLDAQGAFRALRAFWNFLKREFSLPNADACLAVLSDKSIDKFDKAMNDPSNFGMAKAMVMMGAARGYDMSTPEGIDEWMKIYQAEMLAGTGTPVPFPGEPGPQAALARGKMRGANRKENASWPKKAASVTEKSELHTSGEKDHVT